LNILKIMGKIVKCFPDFAKNWMENFVFQDVEERLPDSFLRDRGRAVNAIVVLGGVEGRVEHALKLYQQGLADYIIVSGGIGPFSKDPNKTEAEIMADYLIKFGVPEDRIWIENESTNTSENVHNTMSIIIHEAFDHPGIPVNPIVVTSSFHLKRTLALFEEELWSFRFAPMISSFIGIIYWSASPSRTERVKWKNCEESCALVAKETLRLAQYRFKKLITSDI